MLLSEEKIITDTDDKNENLDSFLKDVKLIKEIQSNINKLIYEQSEQIDIIDNNLDSTSDKLIESNNYLETATKYKVKMKPLALGAGIGAAITLPITLPTCIGVSAGTTIIVYSCIGGSLLGGFIGYKLA